MAKPKIADQVLEFIVPLLEAAPEGVSYEVLTETAVGSGLFTKAKVKTALTRLVSAERLAYIDENQQRLVLVADVPEDYVPQIFSPAGIPSVTMEVHSWKALKASKQAADKGSVEVVLEALIRVRDEAVGWEGLLPGVTLTWEAQQAGTRTGTDRREWDGTEEQARVCLDDAVGNPLVHQKVDVRKIKAAVSGKQSTVRMTLRIHDLDEHQWTSLTFKTCRVRSVVRAGVQQLDLFAGSTDA